MRAVSCQIPEYPTFFSISLKFLNETHKRHNISLSSLDICFCRGWFKKYSIDAKCLVVVTLSVRSSVRTVISLSAYRSPIGTCLYSLLKKERKKNTFVCVQWFENGNFDLFHICDICCAKLKNRGKFQEVCCVRWFCGWNVEEGNNCPAPRCVRDRKPFKKV